MKPKAKPMPKRSRPSRPPKAAEFREARVPKAPGALRRAAEARLREKSATRPPKSQGDPVRLQHDLKVHKIELELQNEELRRTQVQLETALEQYTELYDFAPAGYLTLGRDGSISRADLTAAGLLGIDRSKLLPLRLAAFVAAEDLPAFANLLTRAFESKTAEAGEVRLSLAGKPPLTVQLRLRVTADGQKCRVVLLDITERKRLEEERGLTLQLLDRINSSPDLRTLMREVTLLLREATGCEAVGIRLQDGEDFPYFQTAGFPPEFVQAENTLCAVDPQGQVVRDGQGQPVLECLCGHVLCGRFDPAKPGFTARGSFWTNCLTDLLAGMTEADRHACQRDRCNREGYESMALVRLRTGGETLGLLQFNDQRRARFTPAKLAHLEQIADHLAVALARWQAEAALQQSEVFAKSVLNALTSHIAVVDEQGTVVAVNDAWRHFARENGGTDPAVHVGANYLAVCQASLQREPDPVVEAVLQGLRAVISGERKEFSVEYPCHAPQEPRWFTVRGTRFPGPGPVRVVVAHENITERKRTEAALRESEQRHRTISHTAMDGFWRLDLNGRLLEVNEAYCRMSGYTEPELLAMGISDLEAAGMPTDTAGRVQGILTRGQDRFESWHCRKDGSIFPVEVSVQYKPERGEHPVAFLRDITQRKQAEETLHHLSARLLQLRDEERRHIARELHDSTVQDLAAVVVNLGFLHTAVRRPSPEARQALLESLGLAERAATGLRTLTYLLHPPLLEELGLAGALREFVGGFTRRSGIRVDLKLKPAWRRMPAELELALFRVIQESLANIHRHSGSTSARITLCQAAAEVRLEVCDAGHGFILESSERGGPAAPLGVGITGMRERLRELGGLLTITSDSGGTTIRATLPCRRPEPNHLI